ncbi:RNA-directed DNA polymerase, eukaryota [Tanacetum coccineum]
MNFMSLNIQGLTQKAKKDWVKELCMYNKVNVLSLQETKMETIESISIKMCWGNFAFDFVYSASVGNSGVILCVWDPRCFHKSNATISDYFIMIRGVWVPNGKNLLIISVYAPQELSEKKMLWDYLTLVIANWKGGVVMMGDFNEVHKKEERFGSNFNVQRADAFNFFISNAGLEEVPSGGYSFTWCHKSASKMSKLDRFLISKNLMNTYPNISAITLDRYLSDHRPILLRESKFDYGPILWKLFLSDYFNYWFDVEGLTKFVEETWMMLCEELAELDAVIDKGEGNEDVVNKRMKVFNSLKELDKLQALEAAQINQLTIRGVLVDGIWIESPSLVKSSKVGGLMSRIHSWNETVNCMVARLSKLKMKTLSVGVDIGDKKPICVKWKNALASKEKGGLGVSSLYALNRALMLKWKVKATYLSIWFDIVHELEVIKKHGINVVNCIQKKLGNRVNTYFWEDTWRGDVMFKTLYPRLYALETIKDVTVASKLSYSRTLH